MSVEDTLNQDSPPILSDAKDDDNTIDMISSSSEARSKAIAFNPNLSIPSTKIETLLNLKKSPVSVSSSSSSSLSSGSKKSTTAETKDSDDNDVQLQNYQLLEKQEQLRKLMSRLNIDGEPSAASSKFSSYFGGDNDEDGGDDDDDFGNDEEDKAKREEIFAKVTNLSTWTSTPEQDKRAKYSELFEALLNLKDPVTVINRGFIAFLSLPGKN